MHTFSRDIESCLRWAVFVAPAAAPAPPFVPRCAPWPPSVAALCDGAPLLVDGGDSLVG